MRFGHLQQNPVKRAAPVNQVERAARGGSHTSPARQPARTGTPVGKNGREESRAMYVPDICGGLCSGRRGA